MPLGIIITESNVITLCLRENVIIGEIPENYLDIGNLLNANKNN